jgi:flagellin-like protein
MNYRKFRKNAKALSPVIATIILIAVTVAVSVVVAAWMGALTIGFMGNAEQASITNAVLTNHGGTPPATTGGATIEAVVTVQNTGSATVTITSATIDGASVNINYAYLTGTSTTNLVNTSGQVPITKGTAVDIYISGPTGGFANSAQYTIKLMTAKGNTVTTTATYTGS